MPRPLGALRAARVLLTLCGLVSVPAAAVAQSVADAVETDPPAHIAFVEGSAVLERDGSPDASPANMPLLAGDRVRTQGGRVEILFADGSTLHLDANTTVDFQSDELVRLLEGRVRLAIAGPDREVSYRIDAPSAWAQITQPGEYRVAILRGEREPEVEVAVIRGAAELVNESGRTELRAGERAFSRVNIAPSHAYAFNSATWDAFDRWSEARRDERRGVSAQYLPEQVRPYSASFDRYGAWRHEPSYGYVWYPTVSTGWRPYHHGRWATLRPYGWTWIGSDPWAWPTHHFGRWGFSAGLWFWIPGRSWAPAWVSWAYAPGYVSWCPLGWNNRPVLQIVNVNFGRGYDPWRAWTVVPRHHFGVGFVHVRGIPGGRFDARTRHSFVSRNAAPDIRGYAVPRASAPIRVAGTRSGPRGGSPVYTNLSPDGSRLGATRSRAVVGSSRSPVAEAPRAGDADAFNGRSRAVRRSGASGVGVPSVGGGSRSRSAPGIDAPSAAPRSDERYAPADRGPRAVPREDRLYRGTIASPQRQPESPAYRSEAPARSRSVPRAGGGAPQGYGRDAYAPRRSEPDRGAPRAVPRAMPESTRPPSAPEHRQSPPSRPAGPGVRSSPPPSSARPSAPEAGASRPRSGGQPSAGTARPRGGGGRR
jgi:hypothetical protein